MFANLLKMPKDLENNEITECGKIDISKVIDYLNQIEFLEEELNQNDIP